jgi:hypothetical protein
MAGKLQRTLSGLVSSTSENVALIQLLYELYYGDKKLTYKPHRSIQQSEDLNYISNLTDRRRQELLKDTCCMIRMSSLPPLTPLTPNPHFESIVVVGAIMFYTAKNSVLIGLCRVA